ncbi:MAG: MFS transporter [Bacteroidales bacterium]|nr:MFS transporter [Bacteroidales bacterium]
MNKPFAYIPTLYLYQAIPYSIVMTTSVLMYQQLGISAASFTFWTSLLYLPWTIKPLWSPIVESLGTKRQWVVYTQILMAMLFVGMGFALECDAFYVLSLISLAIIAFTSASHDIACDGFYILALNEKEQKYYVGIRSTFYRLGSMAAIGLIPILVGQLKEISSSPWTYAFIVLGGILGVLAIINALLMPNPTDNTSSSGNSWGIFIDVIASFFSKPGVVPSIAFMLLYRLGEAQLSKIATPFLVDAVDNGGLALTETQYGLIYGTAGLIALTVGGILGGFAAGKWGLKRTFWPMVLAMNLPNIAYVLLAQTQPDSDSWTIWAAVITEQFGYGFGFCAYMLFLINYVKDAKYKTAEYALATAVMALGMMLPGMVSGWIFEQLSSSYELFFIYVLVCCIPGMLLIPSIKRHISEE